MERSLLWFWLLRCDELVNQRRSSALGRVLPQEAQTPRKILSTERSSKPGATWATALVDDASGEPAAPDGAGATSRTAPQTSHTRWWCGSMFGSKRPEPGERESAAQSPADESAPSVL